MKSIGIQRSNSIELIDATVVNGSIMTSLCPGDLGISCSDCPHAWTSGSVTVQKKSKKDKRFPLLICRWHDTRPNAPG